MRIARTVAVFLTATVATATLAVASPGTAFADDTTTTGQVAAAIDNVDAKNGALVADAIASEADADSAAQTATVDIPANPTQGVKFTTNSGELLTIGLPNAKHGGKGTKTRKGVVAYSGKGGSANAVVPTSDGGVQLLTVVNRKKAPTTYAYPVTLPQGGHIEVAPGGTGAGVFNASGEVIAVVMAPWAKDANGKTVPTHFTTDGKTLTQHIAHQAKGVQYPVVADPVILPAWAVARLFWCLGGGLWGFISGGGNSFDERLYQAAIGCLGFATARQLFRR